MKNIHMREKVQHKLNSMASILIDDIVVPGEHIQQGNETVTGSYYDEDGNKFTFTLSLVVTPKESDEEEDPILGVPEQVALILEKLEAIESDVANLKAYHSTDTSSESEEPQVTDTENNNVNNPQTDVIQNESSTGDNTGD